MVGRLRGPRSLAVTCARLARRPPLSASAWYRREDPDCADVGEAFLASTISPSSLQELSLRYPDDCRNGRTKPARTQEDLMTELTLHPADGATAARPHAL